jgi:hypothetical protein
VERCPSGSYLLGRRCVENCSGLWAQESTALCVDDCAAPALKTLLNSSKLCLLSCLGNYYIENNYTCLPCVASACENLLTVTSEAKSIFNVLYIKLTFSQSMDLTVLVPSDLTVTVRSPITSGEAQLAFVLTETTKNAAWLKLSLSTSLSHV